MLSMVVVSSNTFWAYWREFCVTCVFEIHFEMARSFSVVIALCIFGTCWNTVLIILFWDS